MSLILERLRRRKDDRGMMSALRCILVEGKKQRAWPALSRLGIEINDDISSFIAGLYATHPDEATVGNFGTTCRNIGQKRGEIHTDEIKVTPTERRFQHLLSSERTELSDRIMRMVLLAKAQSIPINYVQLEKDMRNWNDRTKTAWATSYWTQSSSKASIIEEES